MLYIIIDIPTTIKWLTSTPTRFLNLVSTKVHAPWFLCSSCPHNQAVNGGRDYDRDNGGGDDGGGDDGGDDDGDDDASMIVLVWVRWLVTGGLVMW